MALRIRNKAERKRAQKRYYEKTKESRKSIRHAQTQDWLKRHPNYHKDYRKDKAGLINAKTARRRAKKLRATPLWLTDLQKEHIKMFYECAAMMTKETGTRFEVDHIMPLQGKLSSGLHVPWNLQVIPMSDNRKKGRTCGTTKAAR